MSELEPEIESVESLGADSKALLKYWRMEIKNASQHEQEYRTKARELIDVYHGRQKMEFNILWSNVETLKPVVYGNSARPDVRQRYKDGNPVSRGVAMVLERGIGYTSEQYDDDSVIREARDEMLITGRGVLRLIYQPDIVEIEAEVMQVDPLTGEASVTMESREEIAEQIVKCKFISFEDFRMSPAKCWDDVRWVAFRHLPSRDELETEFGEVGSKIPLNHSLLSASDDAASTRDIDGDAFKRAEVWEIWDKVKRQRIFIAEGYDDLVRKEDDPLSLEGFFPMPKPVYSFSVPGTMIPRAEYEIYAPQVEVLNRTSKRITALTKQLKIAGIYNAVNKEAAKILTAQDGVFTPIVTGNIEAGVKDMVAFWPFEKIAQVLAHLYKVRDDQLNLIYQVTGLSDLVRGSTNAGETATAQQLKGNFATMRMQPRQMPLQEMIRDMYRIKAEIIAEHFTPDVLQKMTQLPVTPEMMEMMRQDKLRCYNVDIETDSTVQADADSEKQRRIEFLTSFSDSVNKLAPLVQAGLLPVEMAKEMLMFTMRAFKPSRELEDAMDSIGQEQQQQPQQDDGGAQAEMQKAQMEMQVESTKMQQEMQIEMAKLQQEGQLKREQIAQDMQLKREQMALDAKIKTQTAMMGNAYATA